MSRVIYSLLRRLSPPDDPSSDAALLHRFAHQRDQTAFELLVWRHGGLVLGVCRRVLRDEHLAEDAFQATFLILARKAGSVRGLHNGALAGWLHQVARRVCLRALKRNPVPLEPGSEVGTLDPDPLLSAELRTVLDEEIARLPEKQRLAVLLCYLQGRTTDDAAKLLGVPRGTVLSRLDTARKRLQAALTRRGVAVPAVLFAGGMVAPDLPAEVCRRAAALAFEMSPNLASIPTQLAHEVMHMTTRKAVLGVAAVLVLTAGVGTGVGLVMAQGGKTADKPSQEQKADDKKAEQKPTDAVRNLRKEKKEAALKQVEKRLQEFERQTAALGGDPSTLRAELDALQKQLQEYQTLELKRLIDTSTEQKLRAESEAADFELKKAQVAMIQPDVLSAAVRLHPKVEEISKKLSEMRTAQVNSRLPANDPERATQQTAIKEMEKSRDETEKQVRQEVERYLRVPEVVRASNEQRMRDEAYRNHQNSSDRLRAVRDELQWRIKELREKLSALEPIHDERELLREKRKQLKRELLDLETE